MKFTALNKASSFIQAQDLKNPYNIFLASILNLQEEDTFLKIYLILRDIQYRIWIEIDIKLYLNIELILVIKIYLQNKVEAQRNRRNLFPKSKNKKNYIIKT